MKKTIYRVRQYIFSVFVKLVQNKKTKLIRGENSLLEIPNMLYSKGLDKVLVVTTNGFIKRKTLEDLFLKLDSLNIKYKIFTNLSPDPSVDDVEAGVKDYKEFGAKAILAIGGGSVLDCAKIIGARVSNPKKSVRSFRGMLKVRCKLPPFYPVPATCGTGSEVTAAAVISDEIDNKHYKYAITDLKLIPSVAYLDPTLLKTLPPFMLSTTVLDALTHSLEAYTNLFATSAVKRDSLESIKLIFDNFNDAYLNKDIKALDNLLYASTLAGIAITHNFVGYVHALSHAMGAIYGLSHGYLNSIILPVVLNEYESKIEPKMKKLARYMDLDKKKTYTNSIIIKINEIKMMANLPDKIEELSIDDYDEIISRALKEANPTYPVPIIFNKKDLRRILVKLTK